MNSEFLRRAKGRIITALKDCPCTFEELCRRSQGLYPSTVRDIVQELNLRSSLIPVYTTEKHLLQYGLGDDSYYDECSTVTAQIQNNPVLSSWYFSWDTCYKIGQINQWKGKQVLFLGTPRLFEFFASRNFGTNLTLIDLDDKVVEVLSQKYQAEIQRGFLHIYKADLGNFNAKEYKRVIPDCFDYIFFDPPWYLNYYFAWLNIAIQLVKPHGNIVFSLYPSLLRPTAVSERKEILGKCRQISESVFICSGMLEYDIPSFERKELEIAGIRLYSNWKTSDLVLLTNIIAHKPLEYVSLDVEYNLWTEFSWLNMRWFIKNANPTVTSSGLLSLSHGSRFLKSPSKRNDQLRDVNLLSSKGHGLCVSNSKLFLKMVTDIIALETSKSYYDIIKDLEVDNTTKEILLQLGEDY